MGHEPAQRTAAILCDIDGTLAIRGARDVYDVHRCCEDVVREAVLRLLHRYDNFRHTAYEVVIILISGRDERWRKPTTEWLVAHDIPYDALLLRRAGDMRKDAIVKREIYERDIEPHYDVEVVIDDRDAVVAMWRHELGLPCFQVDDGAF